MVARADPAWIPTPEALASLEEAGAVDALLDSCANPGATRMVNDYIMTRLRTAAVGQRLRRVLKDIWAETFTLSASFMLKFRCGVKNKSR